VKLLLDTHFVLWVSLTPARMPAAAVDILNSPAVEPWFSVASIWEIAIKAALDRPDFRIDPQQLRSDLIDNGYGELPITSAHAMAAGKLPLVHRDPFDRMLVAQAMVEDIVLLTHDAQLARYPGPVRLV